MSSIPVLRSSIEEVLASDLTDDQWEFQITQTKWDLILQLFQGLDVQPTEEESNTWYTFIEDIFLCLRLMRLVS